jgi:hypothetical protein
MTDLRREKEIMPRRFSSLQEKRTYQTWADMRTRCNNPRHRSYPSYGGRGIKVCERWDDYELFLKDMGLKPDGLTLERLDNNGNYSPENCKWATYREQSINTRRNRYFEIDGVKLPMVDYAKAVGIPASTLSSRLNQYGWDTKTALNAEKNHIENIPNDPEKIKYLRKLTDKQADEIRQIYSKSRISMRKLSEMFGVSATSIANIIQGKTHANPTS